MKRIYIQSISVLLSLAILIVLSGCEKILNPEPIGTQTVEATFTDFNGSMNAVNGLYSVLTTSNLYRGSMNLINVDLASDDVYNEPANASTAFSQIDYFELVPENSVTWGIMYDFYALIYRSNLIVNRVPKISFPAYFQKNGSGTLFNDQFVGEAQFMRAFAYYNLVRILGDVPLRTEEITSPAEVNIPRSPKAEVYKQIEADLIAASQKLPLAYTGSGNGNEKGRVTRWSALMVLADVYLTQKKYAEAKATSLLVINNTSGFKLNTTYAANFYPTNSGNENTQESLFEVQFASLGSAGNTTAPNGNGFSYYMGPTTDGGGTQYLASYRPTDSSDDNEPGFTGGLIQEYETGDLRSATNFLKGRRGNGVISWLTNKYYEPGRGTAGNGNYVVYRMAEAYLIYAEATNEAGTPDAQAIEYINLLRRRAFGLPLATASVKDIPLSQTQAGFRDIVRSERRKELAMENKRWFDLCRYGYDYANKTLNINQKRTKFNQDKMLFPIPKIELINNPLLVQNPGY